MMTATKYTLGRKFPVRALAMAFALVGLWPVFGRAQRTDESTRVKEGSQHDQTKVGGTQASPQPDALKKYGADDGAKSPATPPKPVHTPSPNPMATAPATKPEPVAPPEEKKKVEPAFLGVHYEVSRTMVMGSYVTAVEPNTPAMAVGLQAGDVITKADGKPLILLDDLVRVISTKNAGEKVTLTVNRNGRTFTVNPALGVREHDLMTYQYGSADGGGIALPDGNILWIEDEYTATRPFLGATFKREERIVRVDAGEVIKATNGRSLIVADVMEGSTAQLAGLLPGDVVTAINGRPVNDIEVLSQMLQAMKVGQELRVSYLRGERAINGVTRMRARPSQTDSPGLGQRSYSGNGAGGPSPAAEDDFSMDKMVARMKEMAKEAKEGPVATVLESQVTYAEATALTRKSGIPFDHENDLAVKDFRVVSTGVRGVYKVEFELLQRSNTHIQVLHSDGKVLYAETLNAFMGAYRKEFTPSSEALGDYYVQIKQAGRSFSRKVSLQ
jgi:membrane-associated protease RseP (regulator of RpoE activity)